MAKIYRIGVIGLVHDHIWGNLRNLKKMPNVKIACAADVNEPLLERVKEEFGVKTEALYKDYRELLKREDIDACLAYTESNRHAEVTEECAERGVHVMVEKPMAANLEQAERMLRAATRAKIKLMINYPTTWNPSVQKSYSLVEEDKIGRVWQMRWRAAHQGPKEIGCSKYFYEWLYSKEKNGAGALMDYCCYGADLCRWFLGQPNRVVAMGGTLVRDYLTVEDNAVMVLGYEKAMGILEASWSETPGYHGLTVLGEKGTIVPDPITHELKIYTAEAKKWETVECPPLAKEESNAAEYFISRIEGDEPIEGPTSPEICRDAQEILEAGVISMETGKTVFLPLKPEKT